MKTVVFVDELLLVNFAAAAALLLGAGLLCGRSCTGLRLCAGSAAAAVSTLALLAPPWCTPLAVLYKICLLYTSPSPRDRQKSRMPSSA